MDRFRFFDIIISFLALLILFPFFIIIAIFIKLDSKGTIIFKQERVGQYNRNFILYKFRTMRPGTGSKSSLTLGSRDGRITKVGYFLRKFKLDELPQLWNVLKGDMSMVGPRPELRKYVVLYNTEEMEILQIKPGITDYASLQYKHEADILGRQKDPEKFYIEEILSRKIELNRKYMQGKSIKHYFYILFNTILSIVRSEKPTEFD